MKARYKREYERPLVSILLESHRPISLECPGDQSRISCAEHKIPKKLGWKIPAEALSKYLKIIQQPSVVPTS